MKKRITILTVAAFFTACYYNKEEQLYNCDITHVSFSTTIITLLNSYGCWNCHSGPAPTGSFSLDGYNNVIIKINDGRLWGAVNQFSGFIAMPQGGPKMSQCDINKLKAWIDAGAPNN